MTRSRHLGIVQCSAISDRRFELRPKYGNPNVSNPTGLGLHGSTLNGDDPRQATFFFHRSQFDEGDVTDEIEARFPDDPGGGTINLNDVYFTWLREREDLNVKPETPVSIVADAMPGLHLTTMEATGTADRQKKAFPNIGLFCNVRVNSEDYAEVKSEADMVAKTWFWDRVARELYIRYAAGKKTEDSDIFTVAQVRLLIGRFHEDLRDTDGTHLPYLSRIDGVPDAAQELTSRDGIYTAGTTLGSIDLQNADGFFDDLSAQWHWDGYPLRLWRGHRKLSDEIADFELIADAIMGRPIWDQDRLRLSLFDRGQLLRKPVELTSVTVKEGSTADSNARDRENQDLPVLYGEHLRVVAYRIQDNFGTGQSNQYRFTSNIAKSVAAVYSTPDTHKAVAFTAAALDLLNGRVDVSNDEFDDADRPPDLVYLDCVGWYDFFGDGHAYETIGEIFEHVLTWGSYGNVPATQVVRSSARALDRGGRRQLENGALIKTPPRVALRIDSGESIADVLDRFCSHTATYWGWNRQGRAFIDVPDFDAGNLITNGFFELDADAPWPWFGEDSATLAVTQARSFAVGQNSLEISNGSDSAARAVQRPLFHRTGLHVVTLAALLVSGDGSSFKVGVLPPDGEEQLSPAHTLSTTEWTRVTFPVQIDRGHVGQTEVRLYPAEGVTSAVVVAVDAIEAYPLAGIAEHNNSEILSVEYEDDDAYEAAVAFAVNQQDLQRVSKIVIKDVEALGLSTVEPEGKHITGSAGRIDPGTPLIKDAKSAGGIAAPLARTHGRQRQRMRLVMKNLSRIPSLSDRIIHGNHPRVPESADLHPVWRVVAPSYDGDEAQNVLLTVRRHVDPAVDRMGA